MRKKFFTLITSFLFGINILSLDTPVLSRLETNLVKRESVEKSIFKVFGAGAPGSGVLVILPDKKAAILTSKHVIEGLGPDEIIEIEFDSNNFLEIKRSNTLDIERLDLSIIYLDRTSLEANMNFNFIASMLEFGDINTGNNVFVAGYPISNESITKDVRISDGKLQNISNKADKDGYDIGYSSPTYIGMSGGGLFSNDGKLIGIHGRGERIDSKDVNKTGTNFAVSISKLIDFYRTEIMDKDDSINIVNASRQILFYDYKAAYKSWNYLARKYPDSFIANYNKDCLNQVVNNVKMKKDKYSLLFERDRWDTIKNNENFQNKKGFEYVIINDPLLSTYWEFRRFLSYNKDFESKFYANSLTPSESWQISSVTTLAHIFENFDINFRPELFPNPPLHIKKGCELFSVTAHDSTYRIGEPSMTVPLKNAAEVTDEERP